MDFHIVNPSAAVTAQVLGIPSLGFPVGIRLSETSKEGQSSANCSWDPLGNLRPFAVIFEQAQSWHDREQEVFISRMASCCHS